MVLPPIAPRRPLCAMPAMPTMIDDTINGTISIFNALMKMRPKKS